MFTLGLIILYALVAFVFGLGADPGNPGASLFSGVGGIIFLILILGLLIPSLAVQVRRFHDQDKSGWFILLNFIPLVGGLIVLVMFCIDGTKGPNRFGPDGNYVLK